MKQEITLLVPESIVRYVKDPKGSHHTVPSKEIRDYINTTMTAINTKMAGIGKVEKIWWDEGYTHQVNTKEDHAFPKIPQLDCTAVVFTII